jgi:hypothetical protein
MPAAQAERLARVRVTGREAIPGQDPQLLTRNAQGTAYLGIVLVGAHQAVKLLGEC